MPRPAPAPPPPAVSRRARVIIGLVLAVVATLAAWSLWPRSTLVAETVSLARGMLVSGGSPDRQAIRQVTANVDRMPREQVSQLRRAVAEEWERLRQQAIDRYFTAPGGDKPQLLDAEIARLAALSELAIALNPDADPRQPPRLPRDRGGRAARESGAARPTEAERRAEADRRAVAKRYEEALAARAKSRGIRLPTFR